MREIADPYAAIDSRAQAEKARERQLMSMLSIEYEVELHASIARWRASHDREYTGHRITVLQQRRLMGKQLTKGQQLAVDQRVAARIRDAEGWPTRAAWIRNRMKSVKA